MAVAETIGNVQSKRIHDLERLRARIHHHLRTCSAAVKRARTFEVQRTIKKLKAASVQERQDLESLLDALKSCHHGQLAAIAIKSKLTKVKLLPKVEYDNDFAIEEEYPLAQCIEELNSAIGDTQGGESNSSGAGEKAKAKLSSHKLVSGEVSKVVKELSDLLQEKEISIGEGESNSRSKKKAIATTNGSAQNEVESQGESVVTDTDQLEQGINIVKGSKSQTIDSKEEPHVGNVTVQRLTSGRTSDTSKVLVPQAKKRMNEESEDFSVKRLKRERRKEEYKDLASSDDSLDDEGSSNGYLPALTTGFVGGKGFNLGRDSDDEWSDGDADLESIDEDADGSGKQKEGRKNRMGQRARRAIWEKKFGKGANHLKLRERETKRKAIGAQFGRPREEKGRGVPMQRDAGWSGALGQSGQIASSTTPLSKSKVEIEMHPSWIAKQREKERAEAAAQSRGKAKKIVFD